MSEVRHTPGPWRFFNGHTIEDSETTIVTPQHDPIDGKGWKSKSISICNDKEEILAEVKSFTTSGFMQDFNQWEANARLIVDAPTLLIELELLAERLAEMIDNQYGAAAEDADCARAFALIKKIKGL